MTIHRCLIAAIEAEGSAALVRVEETAGSAPREVGAAMAVRPSGGFNGTIGGGAMEWRALGEARDALARGRGATIRSHVALGPELAQCCGGRVAWRIDVYGREDLPELSRQADEEDAKTSSTPVFLFGAGHVGRALVLALAPLPFSVSWIDSRAAQFPQLSPAKCKKMLSDDPPAELAAAPDSALILVMTHSHPLDLAIAAEALRQDRFGYVGLIGSETKKARFLSQMRAAGLTLRQLDRRVCPIGVPGVTGKAPAVIAASVAVQLLQVAASPFARI